jgi:phage host-nuclease inhibitor protein Gam
MAQTTRLKDTRKAAITTMDEAAEVFNQIARTEIQIIKIKAQAENQIATIKAKTEARMAEVAPDLADQQAALVDFINDHQELFKKPRMHKTSFGGFGLRAASNLEIDDAETVLDFVIDQDMSNCFEVSHKLAKGGLKAAIEAGTAIPGAHIAKGLIVKYAVDTSLIKEAKEID